MVYPPRVAGTELPAVTCVTEFGQCSDPTAVDWRAEDHSQVCPDNYHTCTSCTSPEQQYRSERGINTQKGGNTASAANPWCDIDADCYCDADYCNEGQQTSDCAMRPPAAWRLFGRQSSWTYNYYEVGLDSSAVENLGASNCTQWLDIRYPNGTDPIVSKLSKEAMRIGKLIYNKFYQTVFKLLMGATM